MMPKCPWCNKPQQSIKMKETIRWECRDLECKDLIKPGKKMALTIEHNDPIYFKGINVTFISLNDVEYNPKDRWIQLKG
jgi:hypothetical protein